ncbi:MAG: hypothetical protein WAQ07_05030 [Candidatus Omnitrophota bacterium]
MSKNNFFGRQAQLELLNKRVSGLKDNYRQNIAIIGDELVGKTSLIFKFIEDFHDNQILTLFIDTRIESVEIFSKRFIGVLLYNFLSNSGLILKEDLDFLIDRSLSYIPKTTEKIKSILNNLSKRKTSGIFPELISLCESLYQETGKSSVIIFDEFHNLELLGFKNFYKDWSKILVSNKNIMFIIISSLKFKASEILSKGLSLLFGNFEVITIEPFDTRTSMEYLNLRLKDQDTPLPLKEFIIHFTGGYPMYMDIISDSLITKKDSTFPELLEDILFATSGALNQRFVNYLKRFDKRPSGNDSINMLYLISSGRNKLKELAHILRKKKSEVNLMVTRLLELDTITRSGDFLRINDRVFSFWLKFVYQEKLNSLTFDAKNQKARFRDQIDAMVQEFTLISQKTLMERMNDLFRLFEDEILQIEKKKIRLNHFREIKPLEFKGDALRKGLIGRSDQSLWIVAVKAKSLKEEDIIAFSKECRKYRHKQQRKVIVTLDDIDANTRLRAMEEKVWAWDIDKLNYFFDLYSRPRVIS